MRFVSRFRTVLANLRGFKMTLTVDTAELRPGEAIGTTVQFTFHDRALPEATIHLFQDEVEVASGRTLLDGTWSHTLSFTNPGVYDLIARYQTLALTVESNLVTVLVGYLLTIQSAAEGGTTDPVAGTYRVTADETSAKAEPDPNYTVGPWNLDGELVSANPITVDMRSRDRVLIPSFIKVAMKQLTINVDPEYNGGTTDPAPGVYKYPAGTSVKIRSVPYSGFYIDYWHIDGKIYPSTPPQNVPEITVVMDADHKVTVFYYSLASVTIQNTTSLLAYMDLFRKGVTGSWRLAAGRTETQSVKIGTIITVACSGPENYIVFAENHTTWPTLSSWNVRGPVTLHIVYG